ncbi:hypothetical protein [Nonomuraea dietziae]|uniref:hypothetical protein n=1 Tax=Nonomuraea dietziae TaxID=65515 RepID=UPI003CD07190
MVTLQGRGGRQGARPRPRDRQDRAGGHRAVGQGRAGGPRPRAGRPEGGSAGQGAAGDPRRPRRADPHLGRRRHARGG